jgi:hypothetical protein
MDKEQPTGGGGGGSIQVSILFLKNPHLWFNIYAKNLLKTNLTLLFLIFVSFYFISSKRKSEEMPKSISVVRITTSKRNPEATQVT